MSRVTCRNRLQRRKLVLEALERREVLTSYFVDAGLGQPGNTGAEDSPFATIREGIEAALAAPGDDEVVIAPSATRPYTEPIALAENFSKEQVPGYTQFNGNLVIRGSTGNAADVVLESSVGSGIYIDAPIDVTIQDLTVSSSARHGIINRSHHDVLLDNLIVRDHQHTNRTSWSGIIHQGSNLTVRNSELFNNWQGIWTGFDDSVPEPTAPGSLTVENTISRNNHFNGMYARGLTDGFTTVDYSGIDNGSMGLFAELIGSVSISGGSFSNNAHKGMSLGGVRGATVDGVLVEGNGGLQVEIGSGGAGIKVYPGSSDPILISNSIIRNNATNRWGGGFEMYNTGAFTPTITFLNSEISGNKTPVNASFTGRGGGISMYGGGSLEILGSKILNNEAGQGGGVYHQSLSNTENNHLTIDGSTFDGNTGYFNGGLDRIYGGTTTIANSTFSNNKNFNGSGGLRLLDAIGSMSNVTVSGNTSTTWVGGMTVLPFRAPFPLTHSTIVDNTGSPIGGLYVRIGQIPANTVVLANNVIASNHITYANPTTPDVFGNVISRGGNFVSDATGGQGLNPQIDLLGSRNNVLDPVLGALKANGGKTLTHMPLDGSPLINAAYAQTGLALPSTDQRGVSRPQRGRSDIGSVEVENNAPTLEIASPMVTVNEGNDAENSGSFSDSDGDSVTLIASIGTVTAGANGSWQWSLTTDDGPAEAQSVVITAIDAFGAESTIEFELDVQNMAPTLQISATSPIQSGQATTLTLSATDPSQADVDAGFSYQIDWDSDGIFDEVVDGSIATPSHIFTMIGVHTITAQAVDKDGGVSELVSQQITVDPVPLDIAADPTVNLNAADNGKKTFEVVVPSTLTLDATEINLESVVWAGAHLYKSSYKDVDRDGDMDAIFEFLLTDSNARELYRQAMAADASSNHKSVTTEMTCSTSDGVNYLGAAQVDLFMNGKALKDLLDSI